MTPTARTLAECRKRGWTAQVVEQTIPRTFIKRDLFGVIDIIALTPQGQTIGIQATGDNAGDMARRERKIIAEPRAKLWLECGNLLEVWGWGKRGRGKRKLWTLRIEPIAIEMFGVTEVA